MVDEQYLLPSNKEHTVFTVGFQKYCPSFPHTGNDFVCNSNVLYLHRLSQASRILGTRAHSRAALWWAAEGLRGEAMCAPWRAGELWPFSDHVLTETQFHLQDGEDGVCPAHPREGLWGAARRHDQTAETVTSAQYMRQPKWLSGLFPSTSGVLHSCSSRLTKLTHGGRPDNR